MLYLMSVLCKNFTKNEKHIILKVVKFKIKNDIFFFCFYDGDTQNHSFLEFYL